MRMTLPVCLIYQNSSGGKMDQSCRCFAHYWRRRWGVSVRLSDFTVGAFEVSDEACTLKQWDRLDFQSMVQVVIDVVSLLMMKFSCDIACTMLFNSVAR